MQVSYASAQGTGAHNEDHAAAGTDWAFVLDGATAPPGVDTGCRHGVRWLVAQLAGALTAELAADPPGREHPLADLLAAAIERTRAAHGPGCDLGNPDSPSSTVALVRRTGPGFDYLLLADSAALFRTPDGAITAVTDDRLDHLPGGRPYSLELVRAARNSPGGFWVASTDPRAAHEAVTGSVRSADGRFALLTDGVTRLVEYYGHRWDAVWDRLTQDGPAALVAWVRAEERRHGVPRGKPHDDATALLGVLPPPGRPESGA
ncbi:protein phosphatase 2C domain-containing protein [Marinactinospora rubrisoli]|uniref:Protein phosphatase 2C domain-containing protein n=1 Tax=Marinactinospora rubrisoli TaxID=2715399 RepID=A0ABW2KCS0_9ACTN